jgi:hypothetical protein
MCWVIKSVQAGCDGADGCENLGVSTLTHKTKRKEIIHRGVSCALMPTPRLPFETDVSATAEMGGERGNGLLKSA